MDTNGTNIQLNQADMVFRDVVAAPAPTDQDKTIKGKVRKLYNSACVSLLVHYGIATAISTVIIAVYTAFICVDLLLQNPDPSLETLLPELMSTALNPKFLLIMTTITYLIANLSTYFMGNAITKKHHTAKIFGKMQIKPLDAILSVFAILGVQMVSVLVQSFLIMFTGVSGVDDTTAGILSISNDAVQNVLLILYAVVIAPITEELIYRGVVLKAFSVYDKTFALLASSLLFGVMHGNFNQMFNGFLLGLVMGYAALKSKSIILPIILHMVANGHAMLISAMEYRFGESIAMFEGIYIIGMALIGVGAFVWWFVRNRKPNNQTDGYPVISTIEGLDTLSDTKGLTWVALFKSPSFWIFVGIYLFTAFQMLLSNVLIKLTEVLPQMV